MAGERADQHVAADDEDGSGGDDRAERPGEPAEPDRARRMLRLTNRARARAGCPKLRLNEVLNEAARRHSAQMARRNYLGHRGTNGTDHVARAKRAGYPSVYVGENVAAGNADAARTFRQWLNSPGHRENILNCSFTELGVGYAKDADSEWTHYWTQMFGDIDAKG
ncbi:Cysteine-rich secretory protein family protein [Actinopolyspora xinjiangensis]|uniref:Cysteine-rich secretory protein family protein n=2 Tax=Actinopolyspora xinjiangensis TaxID=405564 RepID=A0A1H0VY33_9ACTN|nr:Cysteine-rich secretory protein family protein [Actinopolyspora xinjiangensis]